MAQKQKQHGKVERRQARANVRFQPGFLLLLILLTFAGCFALYMITATAQEDYWEREIVASMEQENAARAGKSGRSGITNPVPSSERAEDSRMGEVAFIGDVATLVTYYETNSGLIFTDAVTDMAESRMRSVARSLRGSSPRAVYLWYQCPDDLEAAADSLKALVNNLYAQIPETPVYLLSATPGTDAAGNQKIDTWNATLFAMADQLGLHYVDVSTTLKANDGTLSDAYMDEETFCKTIGDQILTHVAD